MAKRDNQKIKLLYVRDYLMETDEQHPLTTEQIIARLEAAGVAAERKSIASDVETLQQYGMEIEKTRVNRQLGYYVAERRFELAELKTLVDSVQAAKFLSEKKTMELIKKLASLSSRHEAQLLRRQVYVQNRGKSANESIYYNIDAIHTAIGEDRRVTFRYWQYDVDKKPVFRHEGARYEVSPFALAWDDENYYLIAFDAKANRLKHYRVDKMNEIAVSEEARQGADAFEKVDMAKYTQRNFSMFAGEEVDVVLRCQNALIGVVVDRFGKDVFLRKEDGGTFLAHVRVAVSEPFFGWVCAFGGDVTIVSPDVVARELQRMLERMCKNQ